ncbi:MAG: L-fucose-proton symporter [Candidatus Ordinivivax streblomastigis]|uniref:L-fucose-proton symporter n=1 Tax=Candidatus Ordinivivax streblomastigis TaxID=2540710 RepID=A0A5M8P0X7_9BACT|nr:MAG: L-fucose-proton symporter [Candidatus Ordinivivax streblomastigis]
MTKEKKSGNLVAIIMMIFLFGMISFVTNLASPMGDVLKNQFTVANWVGALGVFANFIAYAVMGIPAGIMLQNLGYKKTALIAIAVGFAGVGIQTLSGLIPTDTAMIVYLLGAFIAGFSMCLLNTVVNPMLNTLGGGGNSGNQLIQIGGTFNSLCGTAVIVLTGILLPNIKEAKIEQVQPLMFSALAIFALAFIVIAIASIPEKEKKASVATVTAKSPYSPLSFRHFILGAIAIFVYVGIEVGIPNVLQKWLQNADLDILNVKINGGNAEAIAASVAGTYWFLMLVGRLIGASIASKVSAKAMLTVVSALGLVFVLGAMFGPETNVNLPVFKNDSGALFGLANVPLSAALLVVCGLCTSIMWGGIFNLAVEGLGKYTEKASGFFMVLVCGGGILPLLQNGIIDFTGGTGYLTSYWVIIVGLAYLLYYALIGSKNVNKNIPVE